MCSGDTVPCKAGCPYAIGPMASCGCVAAMRGKLSVAAVGALDTDGKTGVGAAVPTTADWGPPMPAAWLDCRLAVPEAADCVAATR